MLEAEHFTGPAETGLHFVHRQHDVVLPAELLQLFRILDRQEIRTDTLVALNHHASNLLRLDLLLSKRSQEKIERSIRVLEPVREWDLDKRAVAVNHPRLELLIATGQLRAHRAAVKSVPEAHKILLVRAMLMERVGLGKLNAVFRRLAAGAQQEDLIFCGDRREFAEEPGQRRAVFVREHVGRQQWPVENCSHRLDDFGAAVAGVGDQHATRPVNPPVPPLVGHGEVFSLVPEDWRLAGHGARLAAAQFRKHRQRLRDWQGGLDCPVLGFDFRDFNGLQTILSH